MAHLLLANGEVFHQGPLRITKGKFINAPKRRLHEWFWACGRHESDLAGRANDRNTVYAFQTGDGSYCLHFAEQKGTSSEQSRTERLAAIICADFYENRLDLLSSNIPPARASWDGMPEVEAARQLRAKSVPDDALRMFLTFVAAMDRARDAAALWRAGVALIESHPEVFDPCRAADLPFSTLKRLLADPGVSQRHEPDTKAWRRIAWSLAAGDGSRVYQVIHRGTGNAEELLREVRAGQRFPMLRGEKVGPMWVRMLAAPGEATISRLERVPVAVDVHVRRVSENLGVTSTRGLPLEVARARIQSAWQKAVASTHVGGPSRIAGTCAALDPALWSFGKYGCSHCETVGAQVPIGRACEDCQLPTRR